MAPDRPDTTNMETAVGLTVTHVLDCGEAIYSVRDEDIATEGSSIDELNEGSPRSDKSMKSNQSDDDLTSLTWLHQQNLLKSLEISKSSKSAKEENVLNNNICDDLSENTNSVSSLDESYSTGIQFIIPSSSIFFILNCFWYLMKVIVDVFHFLLQRATARVRIQCRVNRQAGEIIRYRKFSRRKYSSTVFQVITRRSRWATTIFQSRIAWSIQLIYLMIRNCTKIVNRPIHFRVSSSWRSRTVQWKLCQLRRSTLGFSIISLILETLRPAGRTRFDTIWVWTSAFEKWKRPQWVDFIFRL